MRTNRVNVPGVAYHLISRFIDRSWLIETEEEREFYLFLLGRALDASDWRCLAYAIMSSHIHLMMVAGWQALTSWAIPTNAPFASWMNRRRRRIGPLFVRGPKDYAILPENEGNVIAYIHNNPVRARLVHQPRESAWTSHPAYIGAAAAPRWLHVADGLARAGFSDAAPFDEWVGASTTSVFDEDLGAIRRAARRRGALKVGTPTVGRRVDAPLVARPFAHVRPEPRRLVQIAAHVLRISEMALCSRRRLAGIVAARRIVVHGGRALGLAGSDLASVLGLSPQAISYLLRRELASDERAVLDIVMRQLRSEATARGTMSM